MTLPLQSHPFNAGGPVDPVWLAWLRTLEQGTASDNAALASQISAIATALGSPDGTVANIPPLGASQTQVFQGAGIQVDGNAHDGYQISLRSVADSGSGSFLLITKDSFGRVTGTIAGTAADVPYDNTTSSLTADDVQAAIDETVALIPATTDDLPEGSTNLYFPEAPEDGSNYARKDGAWVSFASGGDVVGPASSPDGDFALFDGATGKLLKDGGAPGGMAFIDDAPSDGTTYGRKDGAWEAVTGGGGGGSGLRLVAQASIAGSAGTSLTLSSLSLSAGQYILEFSIKNPTAGSVNYSLFYNSDTTAANYRRSNNFGTAQSNAAVATAPAGGTTTGNIVITIGVDGKPLAVSNSVNLVSTTISQAYLVHAWLTAATISDMQVAGTSGTLDVGSYIKLWAYS
jgi:hypothetical protein